MGTLHAIIALVLALPLSSHHAFAAFPLGCSQVTECLLSNPFQDDTSTSLTSTQLSEAKVLSNIKTIPPFLCQQGWSIEKLRVDLLIQKNCLSFAVYRSIEGREKTLPDYIFRQPIHIFLQTDRIYPVYVACLSDHYHHIKIHKKALDSYTLVPTRKAIQFPPQICEQGISCRLSNSDQPRRLHTLSE